jgi:hypothetical protein
MLKPLCFIAVLVAVSAHAGPAPTKYDFGGIIPQNWHLAPPKAAYERRFTSPDGEASIALRSEHARIPVAAQLERLRTAGDGEITYEHEGRTWIVISGFKGNRIFYTKAMLACGGRAWHYVEFEYPATQKRDFDNFVTRSSKALGAYAQIGCKGA